jgi:hypothetical protein
MLYTHTAICTQSHVHVFILHSVKLTFFCSHADQNIAEVVRAIWKFDQASYRLLSGYAFTACIHKVLRVKNPARRCGIAGY